MSLKRAIVASCLAALSLLGIVGTMFLVMWNELLAAAGPSAGLRTLEWITLLVLISAFGVFALIARREFNLSIEYPQHQERNS